MVLFLYIAHPPTHPTPPQKGHLIFLGLAVSEMEHFMSDNKVMQKFPSKIPGIGNTDKVGTTLQFLQGAHLLLFPGTWQILFLISVLLHLNAKINGPITCHLQKKEREKAFLGPVRNCARKI